VACPASGSGVDGETGDRIGLEAGDVAGVSEATLKGVASSMGEESGQG
jgi:hypothetical protein